MTRPRDAALVALYAGALFAAGYVTGLALGAVVAVAIAPKGTQPQHSRKGA